MGARTQMIVEAVNHDGSRKVGVYHFQWGAGRPMFMVLMSHLSVMHLRYGERLQDVVFPVDLMSIGKDMEQMVREDISQVRERIKSYKESLNGDRKGLDYDLGDGVTLYDSYLNYVRKSTRYLRNLRRNLYGLGRLSMDDMDGLREMMKYMDNNNGLLLVRVKADKWGQYSYEKEYSVDIMVIPGNEDTGKSITTNNPVTPAEYMERYPLCTPEFVDMVETSLKYWRVNVIK